MAAPKSVGFSWRGHIIGAVPAGLSGSAVVELLDNGFQNVEVARYLVRAVLFALVLSIYLPARLWFKQRLGEFVVVLRGYDRHQVDDYRRRLETAQAVGARRPNPPEFSIALRGYEPTQVDEWLRSVAIDSA